VSQELLRQLTGFPAVDALPHCSRALFVSALLSRRQALLEAAGRWAVGDGEAGEDWNAGAEEEGEGEGEAEGEESGAGEHSGEDASRSAPSAEHPRWCRAYACPGAECGAALLRHLSVAADEALAADVLRAMHRQGEARVEAFRCAAWAGEPPPLLVPACGGVELLHGLPRWSWPCWPRVDWCRPLCFVLESLLYSRFEDQILAAFDALGALVACTERLVALADLCRPEDLLPLPPPLLLPASRSDAASASDPAAEADGGRGLDRACAHVAAVQAVSLCRATLPLLAAVGAAGQHSRGLAKKAKQATAALRAIHDQPAIKALCEADLRGRIVRVNASGRRR
jgi:hypothetical protein